MSEIKVVVEQILLLLVVGLIGFMAGRLKYLPAYSDKVISALVVKITAPLMIVTKMYNMEFDSEDYVTGIKLYLFAIVFLLLGYAISLFFRKICKIEGATARVFSLQMMFGNVIYFAIPLISALAIRMPDTWGKGIAYAMFFALGNDTVMWTLGISLISNKKNEDKKMRIKHLANNNSIAFVLGLILLLIGARGHVEQINPQTSSQFLCTIKDLLNILIGKLTEIGSMTAILSIIFIGLMMSKINMSSVVRDYKTKYPLLISSAIKLLLLPVTSILMLKIFGGILPYEPAKVLVIQLAMPAGTLVAALTGEYDSDPEFAAQGVFVSTVLLIITLPAVLWLGDMLLK